MPSLSLYLPAPAKLPPPPPFRPQKATNFDPLSNRLISHSNVGHLRKAITTLDLMSCIRSRNFDLGKLVHDRLACSQLEPDPVLLNSLISLYSKSGDWKKANSIFENMGSERNLVSWSAMVSCFANNDMGYEAISTFLDMLEHGFYPNDYCFASVIRRWCYISVYKVGITIIMAAIAFVGLALGHYVGCCLVDMYSKCTADGLMNDARKVFDRMPNNNVASWTAIMNGYVQRGRGDEEAIKHFVEMMSGLVPSNHFTFSSILKTCANLLDLCTAVKSGLASINCMGNSLISMYSKSGQVEDARKSFDVLYEKNLISYNTVVDADAKHSDAEEAFGLFPEIQDTGFGASGFTFSSLLSGAASICAVGKGEQIHARIIKSGFESYQSICNALVSMYPWCGNIDAAFLVFNEMDDWNVISWTSMITEVFDKMLEARIKPNEITYIAVLSACSHAGLVDEGWKHFKAMEKKHCITPGMEH
ncbi:pentatricopeptide repeat-containing protein [Pyrus ussuriensis x Pyrus communis]|uniref:Pentatricopeptide repeat-containing protein n=1 Tax=Pyrus ussuriensis x Pyrus communis TaxID=2448454 RepID=A0A5N5I4D9_9ROSA|nr:pentatricopeptide repeat-containing protein [Pyrus ussuriensis x Pyrus communis]